MDDFPDMAIFRGSVFHRRCFPLEYRFRQPLLMLFVNADKIGELAARLRLFRWLGALNWRRRDYLPHDSLSLSEAALDALRRCGGVAASGPVYVLAQPRQFGGAYNPAAFYFVCDGNSARAAYLLVEVHNTPWGERFHYAGEYPIDGTAWGESEMQKRRRVSPFNPPAMTYQWRYQQPHEHFCIEMRCLYDGKKHFDATLMLERQPFTGWRLLAAVLRLPFSAAFGLVAIYWHALRLKWRGAPIYREQFDVSRQDER